MKKILGLFLGIMMLCTGATFAMAENYGVYIAPKFMFDATQADYLNSKHSGEGGVKRNNTGVGGALALGYDFDVQYNVPIRLEVEYGLRTDGKYRYNHKNIVAHTPQSVMANAYLDFKNTTDFTPYVGGGVGVGFIGDKNTNFAWNVGAGMAYTLTEQWKLDVGYRYLSLGDFENRHVKGTYHAHEVMAGVRFTF